MSLTAQQKVSLYESKGECQETCEACNLVKSVRSVPTGSLARLTLLCDECSERWQQATELHHRQLRSKAEVNA